MSGFIGSVSKLALRAHLYLALQWFDNTIIETEEKSHARHTVQIRRTAINKKRIPLVITLKNYENYNNWYDIRSDKHL